MMVHISMRKEIMLKLKEDEDKVECRIEEHIEQFRTVKIHQK